MGNMEESIDLARLGRVLWRKKIALALIVVVMTAVAGALAFVLPKQYASKALLQVRSGAPMTYVTLMKSQKILGDAAARTGGTAEAIGAAVEVVNPRNSAFIEVTGKGRTPEAAQAITQAVLYEVQSVLLGHSFPPGACLLDRRTMVREFDGKPYLLPSVCIDIFPLDGWGNSIWKCKAKCLLKEVLLYCYDGAVMHFVPTKRFRDRVGRFNRIKALLRSSIKYAMIVLFHCTSGVFWGQLADRLSRSTSMAASAYSGCFMTLAHHDHGIGEMVPTEALQGKVLVRFEGRDFWAPSGWAQYLTNLYGDYMTLPPQDKRVSHKMLHAYWIADEPFPRA